MPTEPATRNWRDYVGRLSVEFDVANHEDVVQAKPRNWRNGMTTAGRLISSCLLVALSTPAVEPGARRRSNQPTDRADPLCQVPSDHARADPPAWVLRRGRHVGYQMFECNLDAFQEMVRTVSQRYRGKFWGWEWLNEITPGGTPDYVSDYARLCRAGVAAARRVDPSLQSVLAGGLWPRGFRLDVLAAGTATVVDVLPIHYGNGAGAREAREDLESYGRPRVSVWENESCIVRHPVGLPRARPRVGDRQVRLGAQTLDR